MLEDAQTGTKNRNCCSANEWARLGAQWHGARRLAASLPALVGHYLSRLGDSVHLVHVGPRSFELAGQLNGRYHWLPSLTPGEFDAVLARADLFLSANITGTTVAKALTRAIPVMVLHNSVSASTVAEAETQAGAELSPALREWLEQAVPLSPFTLWPLGYTRFLEPILQGNPYTAALERVEILQEEQVEASLASLLFDAVAREDQIHRQDSYVREVGALPRGADLVTAGLEA
jgi:CheY-like chemotaxis protein